MALESVADVLEDKAAGAAPDLRGSLEALERAAQSSREVTIRPLCARHVERMGIRHSRNRHEVR
jgi:hypothetical protein